MLNLNVYYRIYKLIGSGRLRFYALQALRRLGMRYLVVKLDPNWLCNLRCQMCFFSSEANKKNLIRPMSLALFDRIASEVFKKTRILFVGCSAEPLMSPEFERYADVIGSYRIPLVCLVTNGQLLSEKIIRSIIKNGFHQVIVSIDGAKGETYESIRTGGDFNRLLSNLRTLKELKARLDSKTPELRLNFTAMKRNIGELNGVIDLAAELNASTIRVRYLDDWGGVIDYKSEVLPKDVYAARVSEAALYAKEKNIGLLYEGCYGGEDAPVRKGAHRPFECLLPWYSMFIRGDGKIRICSWLPFEHGDLSVQTLDEIERSQSALNRRDKLVRKPGESCLTVCNGNFGGL